MARTIYPGNAIPTAATALAPAAGQAPASNTAAVATLAADADNAHHVSTVRWSYSGDPTGGSLTVAWNDGSARQEVYAITKGGPGFMAFYPPMRFPINSAVTITLAAGGAGITGTVYPEAWKE
jgi:hypothetical protein